MKKFKILEHKADLKIRAFGKNKKEIFLNMLSAVTESIRAEVQKTPGLKERKIKISSSDLAALLVDFLNEILYQIQINKEIYANIKFIKFTDTALEAIIKGKRIDRIDREIKAATYHDLDVREKGEGAWEAVVLFDV